MERKEYISSVIYEGVLYGSGLAVIPFLLDDLKSAPQNSHYGYMASLATLGAAFHLGAFVGKFFSYGFKNCLGYYNTHFVDFFCIFSIVIFGFCANVTWLFIGRIGVGFMAGIQGRVSSVSALLFTDYASYELSIAVSSALFSLLYWSSVDNLLHNSESDIPFSNYFSVHPAALGTLACISLMFLVYFIYFIQKHCCVNDRDGYIAISDLDSRQHSRSYHKSYEGDDLLDPSGLDDDNDGEDLSRDDLYNQVPDRYLRGCKMDASEARRRWHLTLDWRKEENVDNILEEPQPNFFKIKECYPHYFHNRSKDGHIVYFERVGHVDRKKLKAYGITVPDLVRHYVFITEYLWKKLDPDEDHGASISIMDVENVGLRDLMGETLEFLTMSSKIIQGHYVERCHKIFVINAPFLFNAVWKAVQPMVHENTRKKISILGSDRSEMFDMIDASQIPMSYGGTGDPLGRSKEEADLADFVTALNSVERKKPFISTRNLTRGTGDLEASASASAGPISVTQSENNRSDVSAEVSYDGGYINYFGSTFSSIVSTLKSNVASLARVESTEAFLGTKNEYVYDENSNAWVLYSSNTMAATPDDSPLFDPRQSRSGAAISRETSSSSVTAPLLDRERQVSKIEKKDVRRTALSPSAISSLLSRHRQEKGPQVWEFTTLCIVLLIFQSVLIFVLEIIPVWLYLPTAYGGWNYSIANVGLVLSISAFAAASGLYFAGYPKHIVYSPVCTNISTSCGAEIATVELQTQERFRESRASSPFPSHRSTSVRLSSLVSPHGSISNVSLQSLFWLGMVAEFVALLLVTIFLPLYFCDVPAWPNYKNFIFHFLLCGIASSTIFSLAAVYECFIVTKKASVISSSQDMKLTFFISLATMIGSFMGPVTLYLLNVPSADSSGMVGARAFLFAEIIIFFLCLFCYFKPPKYPLYFYS